MKKGFYLMFLMFLWGCNSFSGDSLENLTKQPDKKELSGIWKLDGISNTALHRLSYICKDVQITLQDDGSFKADNFPNVINNLSTEKDKNCQTLDGKWSIEKRFSKEKWAILLQFDKDQIYGDNHLIIFDLYLQNKKLVLRHSFENYKDSDSDNRLLFKKI